MLASHMNKMNISDKIKSELKKYVDNTMILNEPHKVYHFTTIDALISMVEKKTLRLTNSMYMNDRDEFKHFLKYWNKAINYLDKDNMYDKDSVDILKQMQVNEFNVPDGSNEYRHASYFIFSTCLNLELIPMWNHYSDKTGICIEFDTRELTKLFDDSMKSAGKSWFYKSLCMYDENMKNSFIENFIKDKMSTVNGDALNKSISLRNEILKYSYLFKGEQFSYEQENRYIVCLDSDYVDGKKDCSSKKGYVTDLLEVGFYNTPHTIRPCLKIATKNKLPILKIYVSPLADNETVIPGIKRFMNFNGYSIDVEKRQFSYRINY